MVKSELVNKISGKLDMPVGKVSSVIEETLKIITYELAKGNSVQLTGFGTFSAKTRAAREGRNPRTGETIQLEPSKIAYFKQGKTLRAVLNT